MRLAPQTWVLTARLLRRWRRDRYDRARVAGYARCAAGDTEHRSRGRYFAGYRAQRSLWQRPADRDGRGHVRVDGRRDRSHAANAADGLLSRLWVLPVHRASDLLSRLAADAVRIVVTTAVILCAGLVMGFRFRQGILASVAWLFVPTVFGLAFTVIVITLALYAANTIVVEGTEVIWGMLMFFSSGFVPLDQFPRWIQPVVQHQPVSYAVEAMRGLSLGGPVLAPMVGMLLWSAGIVAVCAIPMAIGYRRASMRG